MIKSAAELLQVAALRTRTVMVRDAEVRIRELSVRAREEFLEIAKDKDAGTSKAGVWLVQNAVIGEDGQPLFSEKDAEALAASSPEVVDTIASAVLDITGLLSKKKD